MTSHTSSMTSKPSSMTSHKASMVTVGEMLKCRLCQSDTVDPRVLDCQHTYCYQCLQDYSDQQHQSRRQITCPTCKQNTNTRHGLHNLPVNMFFLQVQIFCEPFLDSSRAFRARPGQISNISLASYCQVCHKNTDVCKCTTKSPPLFMPQPPPAPKVLPQLKTMKSCPSHSQEFLRLYCVVCKVAMCLLCFIVNHSGHKCEDLTDQLNNLDANSNDQANAKPSS